MNEEKLYDAFEKASKEGIDVRNNGERFIDESVWEDYLSSIEDTNYRKVATLVRDRTQYIEWDIFISQLHTTFDMFEQEIGDNSFKLLINKDKFSSENLLIIILWDRIKALNFVGFTFGDDNIVEETTIVVIDDCSYSGNQMMGTIDEISYKNRIAKLNFYVVVPYVSIMAKRAIESMNQSNRVSVKIFNTVNTTPIIELVKDFGFNFLYENFGLESENLIPIYFDHKVAGEMSTFENIYMNGDIPGAEPFGMLLNMIPDTDVKNRVYIRFFKGILASPTTKINEIGMME